MDKEIKIKHSNKEAAKEVGALIAKRALEKNIKTVVYDRGGYVYHGVVKEVAEDGTKIYILEPFIDNQKFFPNI